MTFRRRDFLGTMAALPLALDHPKKNCIVLVLTGGPSQLDTWDMKPDAPREIRGPFRPFRTNVPGIEISEIFPRMARHADKYTLIRSVYSDATPHAHEDGLRMIDAATEGFVTLGEIGFMGQPLSENAAHALVRAASTIMSTPTACISGRSWCREESRHETQGQSFADNCVRARQLVEAGISRIRVNMFDTVFNRMTWDSHGTRPLSTIQDYKDSVGPIFDAAYSTLLEDLHQRGLLDSTLVVAMGEFGRAPHINPSGGRDHWTRCQTVLMAGGGIQGGQIYGSSDVTGSEPRDNPIHVAKITATINEAIGKRTGVEPVRELFT